MILLDTSVLILPPTVWPESYGASILSLAELEFGIAAARTAELRSGRLRRLALYRDMVAWILFDQDAAASYGVLAAEVNKTRPNHARSKDILIAAQAHALGVPLMTHNLRDFGPVDHLVEIREAP